MPGFGRLRSLPDPRDAHFNVRSLLPRQPSPRTFRYHADGGWWGDQGQTNQCVGYSLVHWLEDGPVSQRATPPPVIPPAVLYHEAQVYDEYPGEDYEGTSVRGGAKALQLRGYLASYHWAFTVEDIVETILELGPVVMGTDWYESMMDPNPDDGMLSIAGPIVGGHAYVLNGVNRKTGVFRLKNSWGRTWGQRGRAWIHVTDVAHLLAQHGEAMLAVELAP